MEQNPENYDLGLKDANVKSLKKNADSLKKSHECNQCDYASSNQAMTSRGFSKPSRVG